MSKRSVQLCAVARLFTPEIASFYESVYRTKGVTFVKGTVVEAFEGRPDGDVSPPTHAPMQCMLSGVPVCRRWVWWS